MDKQAFKTALRAAQEELAKLTDQQNQIERKIAAVKQTIAGLSTMLNKELDEEDILGVTDAIRNVLMRNPGTGFAPKGVKTNLIENGFPIKQYRSPIAIIHTVLKRLVKSGEVRRFTKDGRTFYGWVGKR